MSDVTQRAVHYTCYISGQSVVLAELLYATSNLLVFVNDAILRKAAHIKLLVVRIPCEAISSFLEVYVTVIEPLMLIIKRIEDNNT